MGLVMSNDHSSTDVKLILLSLRKNLMQMSGYSGPPLCGPLCGYPSYKATISEKKSCLIVSTIPLTRGHRSNKAKFSIPQGWPYKRGTTVLVYLPVNTWFLVWMYLCQPLNVGLYVCLYISLCASLFIKV